MLQLKQLNTNHNKFNKRDCQQHHAATNNTASYLRGGRGGGNGKQKDHKQNGDVNDNEQKRKSMVIEWLMLKEECIDLG